MYEYFLGSNGEQVHRWDLESHIYLFYVQFAGY